MIAELPEPAQPEENGGIRSSLGNVLAGPLRIETLRGMMTNDERRKNHPMTLQQLRYLIAVAQCGSISKAAHEQFISQSSVSVAIKDLERECGTVIFDRSAKGITLTPEGAELLAYARQVVEQADLLEERFSPKAKAIPQRLAISSQHYAFPVEAFLEFVERYEGEGYTFSLRETRTAEIIEDVRDFKSDMGIIYRSSFNEQVIDRTLENAGLTFHPLFQVKPHIFVGEHHPLADRKRLRIEDMEAYPRYSFDQGSNNSFFFAEEPFAELPHEKKIIVSDRGTLSNLLAHHQGYTVSTGVLSSEMHTGIVSIPLETDERMVVGYIIHTERQLSPLAQEYIEMLKMVIEDFNMGCSNL